MKHIFFITMITFGVSRVCAQNIQDYIKGHFSGSYENYTQYYLKDTKINAFLPPDKMASNGFLKLDYQYGDFSAGIQSESYLPAVAGYFPVPTENKSKIVNKYFRYNGNKFSVQIGDFYDQFGNGLVFRAFENRQIGINNALEGFKVEATPLDFMKLKVIYGKTRVVFDYLNAFTRGADMEFDLPKLFHMKPSEKLNSLTMGCSVVSRYQEYAGSDDDFPATVNAYAGRLDYSIGGFSLNTEYAHKEKDPHLTNGYSKKTGDGLQINAGFSASNFGSNITFRSISNMDFKADRKNEFATLGPVNYLPAITKQHDNLTSNIYVYAAQPSGESGFQADLFYTFPAGSAIGGKYGTTLAFNTSHYQSLDDSNQVLTFGKTTFFTDMSIELRKKWSKKLEAHLEIQQLTYNGSLQEASEPIYHATTIAGSVLYKFQKHRSLRIKLEHMNVDGDKGNWAAGLCELSLSSPFALYVSDLYNYGKTNNHYYNIGTSITRKATRFGMGFGRQRDGLFCVGGVCRFVPAAYGFTATLTTSFSN